MNRMVFIDQEECTGCGLCAEIAPGVFQLNDNGVSEVIDSQGDEKRIIQEAIDECPVECIRWKNE